MTKRFKIIKIISVNWRKQNHWKNEWQKQEKKEKKTYFVDLILYEYFKGDLKKKQY